MRLVTAAALVVLSGASQAQTYGTYSANPYSQNRVGQGIGGGDIDQAIEEAMQLSLASGIPVTFEHNERVIVADPARWRGLISDDIDKQACVVASSLARCLAVPTHLQGLLLTDIQAASQRLRAAADSYRETRVAA